MLIFLWHYRFSPLINIASTPQAFKTGHTTVLWSTKERGVIGMVPGLHRQVLQWLQMAQSSSGTHSCHRSPVLIVLLCRQRFAGHSATTIPPLSIRARTRVRQYLSADRRQCIQTRGLTPPRPPPNLSFTIKDGAARTVLEGESTGGSESQQRHTLSGLLPKQQPQ